MFRLEEKRKVGPFNKMRAELRTSSSKKQINFEMQIRVN